MALSQQTGLVSSTTGSCLVNGIHGVTKAVRGSLAQVKSSSLHFDLFAHYNIARRRAFPAAHGESC